MRLSRAGYFADFYVYPAVAGAFIAEASFAGHGHWESWGSAIVVGVASWTLVEYVLHRYVLHHVPWIKEQHDAHHREQRALIGTPTYITLAAMLAMVALPAILLTNPAIGCGFTAGMMFGYLWYVVAHYGIHNWSSRQRRYFSRLKRRHALHHHYDDLGNFGVTTGFWDHVFGTNVSEPIAGPPTRSPG
jgi:sterol desaturase/sphingolipid hydroxylase (fatty acid hydroxylase superfamily)